MSSSLVKQSLELFNDDLLVESVPKKKKKEKDPMSLISTNRKGVRRELRKLQKQKQKKSSKLKTKFSTLETYRYNEPVDQTEASVRALQRQSQSNKTEQKVSKVILDHHMASKIQRKKTSTDKKKKEKSVFTEEDFEKFMKEYDFNK